MYFYYHGTEYPISSAQLITYGLIIVSIFYVVYQRFLHPLASYPGPLFASFTNVWKCYYVYKLCLHEKLLELHERHGSVIRIGPNDLHFWDGEAIAPIYKGGKAMGKTEFYDAFTTFNPNLFGGRNEAIHSMRRRQVSHGFSQSSIEKMEPIIEGQLAILISILKRYVETGQIFDMKSLISCFVLDVLGEVAFSRSFDAQLSGRADEIPAINDHIFLACFIGELAGQDIWKALISWSPIPWIRRLTKSRLQLKQTCADCVSHKIANPTDRPDLLHSLLNATDPKSGQKLTELDINTEAFAMLVAGSHSTSGTLALLFWHLLHNPTILATLVDELDTTLGPLPQDKIAYSISGLEASLPYTMACIRENFRINPVFSMNLWRRILGQGAQIGDYSIPHGTNVCISNYVLHHNPQLWGQDHNIFNPQRFAKEDSDAQRMLRYLIPFSIGHRMCIGKNLAMTNILKTTTTLLSMFEFEPLDRGSKSSIRLESAGIGEMQGGFLCRVTVRDLGGNAKT